MKPILIDIIFPISSLFFSYLSNSAGSCNGGGANLNNAAANHGGAGGGGGGGGGGGVATLMNVVDGVKPLRAVHDGAGFLHPHAGLQTQNGRQQVGACGTFPIPSTSFVSRNESTRFQSKTTTTAATTCSLLLKSADIAMESALIALAYYLLVTTMKKVT